MGKIVDINKFAPQNKSHTFQPSKGWTADVSLFTGARYERMTEGANCIETQSVSAEKANSCAKPLKGRRAH